MYVTRLSIDLLTSDSLTRYRSGTIKREEFAYLFCGKLRLLSHEEAEALLGILDRCFYMYIVLLESFFFFQNNE